MKGKVLLFIGLAVSLATVLPPGLTRIYASSPTQPATFFFHRQGSRVLNTISTTLWSNTTSLWSLSSQNEARSISNTSPAVWDYYSEPPFATNTTLGGLLNFTVYLASSSNTGGGTIITGGTSKITTSGVVVPLSTASLNSNVPTSITPFVISIPTSSYILEGGSILDFKVTITTQSSTAKTVTLYFDSQNYPSHTSLPFQSRLAILSFSTLNQTGVPSVFFNRNATMSNRQIVLQLLLFDSLGLYDVAKVSANITNPLGSRYLTNPPFVRVQGSSLTYQGLWEFNLTYSSNDLSGAYIASLALVDNSGVVLSSNISYSLFATWLLSIRTVSYGPLSTPIGGVTVVVLAGLVGSTPVYLGASNSSGWVNPVPLLPDNATYSVNSYWQGVLVNQTGPYSPASPSVTILLSIYQISFNSSFRDGSGNPLSHQPSTFQLFCPNGTIAQPDFSRSYSLPGGNYNISGVLWERIDVTPSRASFNPANGDPTLDLQIFDLTIIVTDQNAQPLPGIDVTVFRDEAMIYQTITEGSGSVMIRSQPHGQYVVIAKSGQGSVLRDVVSLNQNTVETVQLTSSGSSPMFVWQSMTWILLVAAVGAVLTISYGRTRSRRSIKTD